MSDCPSCGHQNIEGVDVCEECEQPLMDTHLPFPATAVEKSLLKDRIASLNPKEPLTVSPNNSISEVLRLMVDHSIGCALVVQDDLVVGVFSERDALMKLNVEASQLGDCPVSQFMTPSPETLESSAKVAFAVQRMDLGGYRHLPVVDENGRPTGIISVRDILRFLSEKMTGVEAG